MSAINVKSEIGTLKKVLLHRPGNELLNLTPDTLGRLLFDDIPFLPDAQKEHDEFVHILRENGVEVVFVEDLMAEVLELSDEIESKFIRQFIYEAGIRTPKYKTLVFEYLKSFLDKKELVLKTMAGIKMGEISRAKREVEKSLVDFVSEESEFLADPIPNMYFTRDPFASCGNGIILNKMYSVTRGRETIYAEYIFNYHPDFKNQVPKYYDRYLSYHIEGGDVLNLNSHIIAVGISQRTELIPCAGGEKTSAEREQWNDGTNTLCIAPGVVVVYNRNNITNNILREHGIKVLEMSSAELSRGRGGPRCMSMPRVREDLDDRFK